MDGALLSAIGISREKFLGAATAREEGGGRRKVSGFRVLGTPKPYKPYNNKACKPYKP